MKKDGKKEIQQKTSKTRSKKNYSMDNDSHKKMNQVIYRKISDKLEQNNSNITHINNINIVNMILSKEKPNKYKHIPNISINNQNFCRRDKKMKLKITKIKGVILFY